MKKYSFRVSIWSLGLLFVLIFSSLGITAADPMDDFSFSLQVRSVDYNSKLNKFISWISPAVSNDSFYSVLTQEEVIQFLKKKLDLFPQSQVPRFAKHILKQCQIHRFDPAYVLSLIEVESHFHLKAISSMGAVGLMQLMIPTANFVIQKHLFQFSGFEPFEGHSLLEQQRVSRTQLMDPFMNTAIGIAYLAWLRDYYQGLSTYHVLAAYNIGPTRMNELLARKYFNPVSTKKYFLSIRRGVARVKMDVQRL